MDERDKLIEKLIAEKGGSREDYLNLLNAIAYHESAHTMDPKVKQYGGGPGRGKYQFEVGKNAGGITAARRTKQYYKANNIPVPEWLQKASEGDDLDVTNLTSEQQDILFLGNMRKHPKADFSKVWKGEESIEDFWANYHWAGSNRDRSKRIKSFRDSLNTMPNQYQKESIKPPSYKKEEAIEVPMLEEPVAPVEQKKKEFTPSALKFLGIHFGLGGSMVSNDLFDKNINEFNNGGTHEQNPLGGIPQGIGHNGKVNTVEEGETSFKLKGGKFIFSNRIKL